MAQPRGLLLLAAAAAGALAASPSGFGPFLTLGLQGVDDQTGSLWARSLGEDVIGARYSALGALLSPGPGVRRYNAFWQAAESAVPASYAPIAGGCPAGTFAMPANESQRASLGYRAFHCYSQDFFETFDDLLGRDAQLGAASALIVYGTPPWAQDPACTGFPWGSGPPFKLGCLPWGALPQDSWRDFILTIARRWSGAPGSGTARASNFVIWNEVQSAGWADPSPILPNRWNGTAWTPAQLGLYAAMIANLTSAVWEAVLASGMPAPQQTGIWLSTDHFLTPPPLAPGDVGHIGLYELLEALWPLLGTRVPWSVAVHPYDAGDPRADLRSQGVYTFAHLADTVAAAQCGHLQAHAGVAAPNCSSWPQSWMYASEQGWAYRNGSMSKDTQARNICFAHGLSAAQGLWAVTHNFFQAPAPNSQGDAGDFSLIDEAPLVSAALVPDAAHPHPTLLAYASTAPSVWGVDAAAYCCATWGWGCPPGHPRTDPTAVGVPATG